LVGNIDCIKSVAYLVRGFFPTFEKILWWFICKLNQLTSQQIIALILVSKINHKNICEEVFACKKRNSALSLFPLYSSRKSTQVYGFPFLSNQVRD